MGDDGWRYRYTCAYVRGQSRRDGSDGRMMVGLFGAAGGLLGIPGGMEGGTLAGREGISGGGAGLGSRAADPPYTFTGGGPGREGIGGAIGGGAEPGGGPGAGPLTAGGRPGGGAELGCFV